MLLIVYAVSGLSCPIFASSLYRSDDATVEALIRHSTWDHSHLSVKNSHAAIEKSNVHQRRN
jgi:hypothetical protein